jgi:excisionase family DNA binding protein
MGESLGRNQDTERLFENQKLGLTYTELSEAIGISVSHLMKLVMRKKIPHTKIGRAVRFIPEEIAAWLKSQQVK